MTVSKTTSSTTFFGNGAATAFSLPFYVASTDVLRLYAVGENGALTELLSGFSFVGNKAAETTALTFTIAPVSGTEFYAARETPPSQLVSLKGQVSYNPTVVEGIWDKLTRLVQETQTGAGKLLRATTVIPPIKLVGGRVLTANISGTEVICGPSAEEISDAAANAEAAAAAAELAGQARDAAVAAAAEVTILSEALKTPQMFGAVGDGVTDDTTAWTAFQAAAGIKFIPAGSYKVSGVLKTFDRGCYGNGAVRTRLTTEQQSHVSQGISSIIPREGSIVIQSDHDDAATRPAIYVSSSINDASGGSLSTKVAGIYSYVEQVGTNTAQGPKAICGVSVNAAAGDNDSTGIVGYTYKLDVNGGIGDAAGAGGACHQFSTQEGLAIGAEFSVHQHVGGTYSSPNARNGNNSMAIHVTSNSDGGRAWAAIAGDSQGLSVGRYGFWNGIVLSRSMFAAGGEGMGQVGTVGINFGNNTTTGPEKAIYLGNAEWHLWRSGDKSIRSHCSSFDIERISTDPPGVRLISPSASPHGGYFGAYKGATGPDGETSLTPMGALIVDSNGYTSLAAYDASGTTVSKAGCSPGVNAFVPLSPDGDGTMSLGWATRRWSTVYAATATISTSDEREKTALVVIPDIVLDAWGDVGFGQFKFLDAIAQKGINARTHTGVIAQRIVAAFSARGLNAAEYGLLCYDAWGDGDDGISAGNRYGVRYEEALCMEAAYQRRRADRIEARLAALELVVGM